MVRPKIAIAFDRGNPDHLLERAAGLADYIKIGPSMLLRYGIGIIRKCQDAGMDVFLDLKLHDIPFQVAGAVSTAGDMGITLLTVHNSGGGAMLGAAVGARSETGGLPRLIGVSVLTSLSDREVKTTYNNTPAQLSMALGRTAHGHGLDGIVCSGLELPVLRQEFPPPFLLVVPGLRFEGDIFNDQQRVTTPYEAVRNGADILVLGRSVTGQPGGWDRLRTFVQWLDQRNT